VLSVVLLKEAWNRYKTLSVAMGFASVILVLSKGDLTAIQLEQPVAIFWVLIGAFSFALFSVLSKRFEYELISLTVIYFLVATAATGIPVLLQGDPVVPQGNSMLAVMTNGLLVNGISYLFWLWALKKADASFVTPFTFATPCISLLYLVLLFDETFLTVYVLAFAMIVMAGFLSNKSSTNKAVPSGTI
jgi:drug/metabolite transporter (DMT)-like permease